MGSHVDGEVAGELRGVDEDASADGMHPLGEGVHGLHHTSDVGRARDGEQRDATRVLREELVQVLFVERAVGARRAP